MCQLYNVLKSLIQATYNRLGAKPVRRELYVGSHPKDKTRGQSSTRF